MWKRLIRFLRYVVFNTVGACALFALASCAAATPEETRVLTKQQDEQIGRACATGCAILPRELYLELLQRNHQMGV